MKTQKYSGIRTVIRAFAILLAPALAAAVFSCGKAPLPDAASTDADTVQSRITSESRAPALPDFSPVATTEKIFTETESTKKAETESTVQTATEKQTTAEFIAPTTPPAPQTEQPEPLLYASESYYTRKIPFETQYVYSDEEYEDVYRIITQGIEGTVGIHLITYYQDGDIIDTISDERVTASARDEVVLVGTRPIYTNKTVTLTENITSYSVRYIDDSSMYEGESEVRTQGVNGYSVNTYTVTYERGVEHSRELISSDVTAPVDKVIAVGTKKKAETFVMPFIDACRGGTDYRVTQYFGGSNGHGGMDFGVWYGQPVTAAMSGEVIYAYNDGYFSSSDLRWTYGTYVVIDHGNGFLTYYAHLSSRTVSVGDRVVQGETVGYSGNSGRVSPSPTASDPYAGTHLHFEIRKCVSGSYVKVDPKNYLPWW